MVRAQDKHTKQRRWITTYYVCQWTRGTAIDWVKAKTLINPLSQTFPTMRFNLSNVFEENNCQKKTKILIVKSKPDNYKKV